MKNISYGRQNIDESDLRSVRDALLKDLITVGDLVDKFESNISNFTSYSETVVVSSGTAALHSSYAALKVKNREVITTPLTFISTASTAVMEGAKIIFCDVDDVHGNLDANQASSLITDKTSVITTVDYAGNPCIEEDFIQLKHKYSHIKFISDASHSLGSKINGKTPGSYADLVIYSFYPTKNITSAEGGAVCSNNIDLISKVRSFKMHGLVRNKEKQRYPNTGLWHQEVHEFGLNYRLSDIHCALGISQLERIEIFKDIRRNIYKYYHEHLSDIPEITLPISNKDYDPMWHLFPIRVPKSARKNLFNSLRSQGVIVQVNYLPVYWHPVFEDLGYKKGMCPVSEDFYEREISLPIHTLLIEKDLDRVTKIIRNFFGK